MIKKVKDWIIITKKGGGFTVSLDLSLVVCGWLLFKLKGLYNKDAKLGLIGSKYFPELDRLSA